MTECDMQRLEPGSVIGILGGGQLGRMIALAAAQLGFRSCIFSDVANSPAEHVSEKTIVAAYTDLSALDIFAASVDVVTLEFENIPEEPVKYLAEKVAVRPGPNVLATAQDRAIPASSQSLIWKGWRSPFRRAAGHRFLRLLASVMMAKVK